MAEEGEGKGNGSQNLRSLLVTEDRDFLVRNNGDKVLVSELEGHIVAFYFAIKEYRSCHQFQSNLIEVYEKLKEKGEKFEVIFTSMDNDEESYKNNFMEMPWLALPFEDKCVEELIEYFELEAIPTIAIIDKDGKTLTSNASNYITTHGVEAYPFSSEKLMELDEIEKLRMEAQTLESLLVLDELDFVLGKDGNKIQVTELVGKTILFYFSRKICHQCEVFTPKLIEAYSAIKAEHPNDFETIFVSVDNDEKSFEEYYSQMPWLVLPYNDKREASLRCKLRNHGLLPHLEVVGPNGRTILKEAKELVLFFGSKSYPFDENRVKEMEAMVVEMGKDWPEKVKFKLHEEHELERGRTNMYVCLGCEEACQGWAYKCDECYFYIDPKCALEEKETSSKDENEGIIHGRVCEGGVCLFGS